jgi:sodium-dependent dicarboxylate transporter 2/3/5
MTSTVPEQPQTPTPATTPTEIPRTDVEQTLLGGSTYRSLAELGRSGAEAKFERGRRLVGWFLAPAVSLLFFFLPMDIPGEQQSLAAVLLGVVVLWICEPIPIPISGLIGVSAIILLGVAPSDDVLAPFGSTTIFTFIGAFILAQAMLKHGVAQRIAFAILAIPGVGRSTVRTIIAFGAITCILSAFVSNTATVAMLMPTALGILTVIAKLMQDQGVVRPDFDPMTLRVGAALMLMLAYGASVGGLLTPVGSPPNLIGRGLIEEATGERISFGQWMATAFPICLLMFVILFVVLLLINRPEVRRIEGVEEYIRAKRIEQGPMSRAEKNTVIAFAVTVSLWLVPAVVGLVSGTDSEAYTLVDDRLNEGVSAVIGAALLFILPVNWSRQEATMSWKDAARAPGYPPTTVTGSPRCRAAEQATSSAAAQEVPGPTTTRGRAPSSGRLGSARTTTTGHVAREATASDTGRASRPRSPRGKGARAPPMTNSCAPLPWHTSCGTVAPATRT